MVFWNFIRVNPGKFTVNSKINRLLWIIQKKIFGKGIKIP